MWTRICSVVAVCVLPAAPCAAQVVLTEADALARLSADSPRIRAIRTSIDIAKAEALAASRWPNPRLAYDRESVAGVTEGMTTVMQALPVSGRRTYEIRAASSAVEAAESRIGDQVRRARADMLPAFADQVAAQTREQELWRARDRLQQLAAVLEKRHAAGDAAGFDRLRALRDVSEIEADRVAAAADRARAQATLASFFADATPLSIRVTAPAARPQVPPLDDLFRRAIEVRGESIAFERDLQAARLQEQAAARRAIPEPDVILGSKTSSVGGSAGSVFAVQMSIPLFDRGRPEQALARARQAQARARSEAFRVALKNEIEALRSIAVERRNDADRYRASAIQGAEELARIAEVSYDAGERGIFEVLDAYRGVAASHVRQALLDAAARQAEIELEFVSGWEMP